MGRVLLAVINRHTTLDRITLDNYRQNVFEHSAVLLLVTCNGESDSSLFF